MSVKDSARVDYELGMKYKDIAEKHDVSINTVKSWKTRDKWVRKKKVAKKDEVSHKTAHKKKKGAHKNQEQVQKVAVEKSVDELNNSDLTEKQKRFCLLYLKNFNATQSYIDVYDADYKTASVNGPTLLGNTRVKELLNKLKKEINQELYLTVQDIASNYAKIAFSDYGQFIKWHSYEEDVLDDAGNPVVDNDGNTLKRHYVDIDIADMEKVDTSLIKSVSKGKDGLKLELYDKMKASQELMKYFSNDKFNDDDKKASPLENLINKLNKKE